ncbi:uncharacterized protein N7483_003745 [Penicillium malachiteum]|uniref:uncharacterized protein n=1 Tax=Penicillium malachiteum TaxID=1324776 RepID=UPI002549A0D2|nr:uncharacterized protein N7483_003745 [Penicillium malachiteum]KAJ5729237.1 hypothetical protein N7483_003745 [Penicillium malachiteum]
MTQIPDVSEAVAILVMGVTGVGKSRFISKLTGSDAGIGDGLTSCEYSANLGSSESIVDHPFRMESLTHSLDTKGVEFHSMMIKNKLVYLVDTPGFNDTYRSDFEIFSEIAFILSQIHRQGMKTAGILYLHRISDNRVSGSTLRNLNLLESMCGLDAAPRMFLVTTMWDSTKEETYEATLRELSLLSTRQFWGRFSEKGSQAKRWRGNEGSALSIVDELISSGEEGDFSPFIIQGELIDEERPLKETTAGLELMSEYKAAENKLLEEIHSLESNESNSQPDANSSLLELREGIRRMRDAQQNLKVSTRRLFAEKENSYRQVLSIMSDERRKLSVELREQKRRYQRLQEEMRSDDELRAEHDLFWRRRRAELEHEARCGRGRRDSIEKECQRITEKELLFNEQLSEFQSEHENDVSEVSYIVEKTRKRDVVKRNLLQFFGVLAGVSLTTAGSVTGLIPLAGAGIGLTLSSASMINLSRKAEYQGPYGNHHASFVSSTSTAALAGAQLSSLF